MDPLNVAKWTVSPGLRYRKQSEKSGEEFRDNELVPALKRAIANNEKLVINLGGTLGYSSGFLDEVFGGLIFECGLEKSQILSHLELVSEDRPWYIDRIIQYITEADEQKKTQPFVGWVDSFISLG